MKIGKWKIETRELLLVVSSFSLAASIFGMNLMLFRAPETSSIFNSISIIAFLILTFPLIMLKYLEHRKYKQVDENFPIFLRDFVETIRGGMTIPDTFKSLKKNDYGALNHYIKKMAAQLDWGIPVETVLLKFSKESKSNLIGRVISSVVESHRFGGNLADTFEALSATSLEVEKLRAERSLYLNSQLMTGYIIFFVFLAVMIGLGKFLVPSLSTAGQSGLSALNVGSSEELNAAFKDVFRNLILIQGFFAGLAVGKMAEGSTISGLKHSMFMMFIGIIAFTFMG
jgi:flagellar protein FlaJ